MLGSGILDLLIGLVLLYFLLASMCLAVQELMAAIFATRAKILVDALTNMLQDRKLERSLFDEFMDHPLVTAIGGRYGGSPRKNGKTPATKSTRPRKYGWWRRALSKVRGAGANRPSYIAAGTFCDVMIDTLLMRRSPETAEQSVLLELQQPSQNRILDGFPILAALHDAIGKLPDSGPKRALTTVINEARGDIDRARAGIEAWFNGTMDRASGWYKRHTQFWVLMYAILLTVGLNADTVMVARSLAVDAPTRTAVANFAQSYVQQSRETPADPTKAQSPENPQLSNLLALTEQSRLPLGWVWKKGTDSTPDSSSMGPEAAMDPRLPPHDRMGWAMKILGLAVTVLAVSLGAPFWFDLLNRLVNVRSSGKPPDPNRPEPPPTPAPPPFTPAPVSAAAVAASSPK